MPASAIVEDAIQCNAKRSVGGIRGKSRKGSQAAEAGARDGFEATEANRLRCLLLRDLSRHILPVQSRDVLQADALGTFHFA